MFEVSIYLQNTGVEKVEIGNLRVSEFVVETSSAKLDLSYNFVAGSAGLHCGLTYNTDLFGEVRVGAMHRHLRQLAEEAVRTCDRNYSRTCARRPRRPSENW